MEDRKDLFDPSYTNQPPQEPAFPDPTINRHPEMPSIPEEVPLQMQGDTSAENIPSKVPAVPERPHGDTVAEGVIPPTAGFDSVPKTNNIPPPARYYYPYGNFNANTTTNTNTNANVNPNPAAMPQERTAPQHNTAAFTQSAAYTANPYYTQLYSGAEVPKQPAEPMNRRIYTMAAIIAALIFLLCLFCIGADLLQGALGTTETGYEVVINVQPPPELDPEDANVAADGTYTVRGVAELVKPSIVKVYSFDDEARGDHDLVGTGSGIIVSEDGFIITNAHVVQGVAFSVLLDSGDELEAELIGSDTKTDLAVLKIDADHLTPATLGDSDMVHVGDNVVAIGNPAGLTNTVTMGIVSAINRQVRADSNAFDMDCIQTDAAISPGNSGGALVNMYGQVIGITSSKYASNYIQGNAYEGLGFAITINEALPIVEELISQGYVSGRFRIGISFYETDNEYTKEVYLSEMGEELPEDLHGLWIITLDEDCDIYNTELQAYDFITAVNGSPVSNYDDVIAVLDGYKGGDMVSASCVRVEEDGSYTYFDIEFHIEVDTSGNY